MGILIGPRISGQPQSENKYGNLEEFTKCVANSGAKLYGTFWCPHCKNQKEAFGEAKEYLPYIECSTEDGQGQLEICAKEGIDAKKASDLLFTAVKLGVTSMPELATTLGRVVPIAADLGIGLDEVTASVSTMTATMGKGSTAQAITNLRGMMNELGKEGSQASDAFVEVAGVGFKAFLDGGGTMQEALLMLTDYANENNTSINNLFGSIEAGQAALILGGAGADRFASHLDEMRKSVGATDTAFETMSVSTEHSINVLKANIATLKLSIAENFAPAINGIITITSNFIGKLAENAESTSDLDTAVKNISTSNAKYKETLEKLQDPTKQLTNAERARLEIL
ncbi:MAG: phage tail tape measure protein, partial [Candidatus Moranbacteria bacterium]|nr:phage tail tape measure protein [Candidatus Moranbacteria bacterium]